MKNRNKKKFVTKRSKQARVEFASTINFVRKIDVEQLENITLY